MTARALPLASIVTVGVVAWAWFVHVGREMAFHAAMPGALPLAARLHDE